MIPRADYMLGKCDHSTYYAQFVTPEVLHLVEMRIDGRRICQSTDPDFNDIPLKEWDAMHHAISILVGAKIIKIDGCISLCNTVCIAKEAARQIKEGYAELNNQGRF